MNHRNFADPYRAPSPPAASRVRRRWVVRDTELSRDLAFVLVLSACAEGILFILFSAAPFVLRALFVWAIFAVGWCAAFVRREVTP